MERKFLRATHLVRFLRTVALLTVGSVGVTVTAADGTGKTIKVGDGEELAAALKSVKEIRAANRDVPVEILLTPGDYDVPDGLVIREGLGFVSSDVAPVTIRAAPVAKPRLCGGRVVKGWKRTSFNGRNDVWVADVSALKLKAQLPLFFHNGTSMTLCRRPNADPGRPYSGGWAYVPGKDVNMYKDIEGERDDEVPVRPEDWIDRARIDEGRICIFPRYNWWNKVLPITSCDPKNHTLRLSRGIGRAAYPRAHDRYHLMGYREDLDMPGEWYHDLADGKVYFIPPDGADPNVGRTAVVADESLAVFRLDCVTNVVIKGLEICEASAAVKMIRSDRCEVVACSLHDIGFFSGNAVTIYGTRCAVRDCDVWNIGAYGIYVSGCRETQYAPDTRDGNVVENNYIHHTGLVDRHGFGVYVGGQGSRVSRNLIHDIPRGGIFYTGRFLTIDRNRIRHVNLEMEDTAAIYGGGFESNTGTRIVDNWVSYSIGFSHDRNGVYSFRKTSAWGIYLDDCSGGAVVAGNLVDHCNGGAMHMHCARFNVISNNVFVANGGKSADPRQFSIRGWKAADKGRHAQYLHTTAQNSYDRLLSASPSWTNYPALSYPPNNPDAPGGYIMQGNRIVNNIWCYPDQSDSCLYTPGNYNISNNVFDSNIIWDGSNTVKIKHEGREVTWEQWRAMGQEKSSVLANPLFKDPEHGDWSFREGSPAPALGIAPIHPENTGLYINENRKTLPHDAEGVREHPEWTQLSAVVGGSVKRLPTLSAVETRPHDMDCLIKSGHIQGACCSEKGFYLSHQMGLDSFDWTGRHLKHVDAPAHLGDTAYAKGRIYGVFVLRGEGRRKYKAKGLIRVWDENLEVIAEKPVEDAALDGVVVLGDTLYVGVDKYGKPPHTDCCIRTYDLDLNFKDEKTIELGYPIAYGVQTMATDGKDILLGNYGGTSRVSVDLRHHQVLKRQKDLRVSEGFGLVPESVAGRPDVFFTVNALGGNMQGWRKDPTNNPPRIQIRFYKYDAGRFTDITGNRDNN